MNRYKRNAIVTHRSFVYSESMIEDRLKILCCQSQSIGTRYSVEQRGDEFFLSDPDFKEKIEHYGIVGEFDLSFAKFLLLISSVKQVSSHPLIFQPTKISPILLWKKALPLSLAEEEHMQQSLNSVIDQLTGPNIYYSLDFDLITSIQDVSSTGFSIKPTARIMKNYEEWMNSEFVFNHSCLAPFLKRDMLPFIVPLLCGHVGITDLLIAESSFTAMVISRINRQMNGTRFWKRGVDNDGNAAHHVVTELVVMTHYQIASFLMSRSTIPLCWSQQRFINSWKQPLINISKANSAVSFNSMRSFMRKTYNHGQNLLVIDLTKRIAGQAVILSSTFEESISALIAAIKQEESSSAIKHDIEYLQNPAVLPLDRLDFLAGTFHQKVNALQKQKQALYFTDADSLDDTNIAQYWVAKHVFDLMIKKLVNSPQTNWQSPHNVQKVNLLWIKNIDSLCWYITGSESIGKSAILKCWTYYISQQIKDIFTKTIRIYQNNFVDYKRQDSRDLICGYLYLAPGRVRDTGAHIVKNSNIDQIHLRRKIARLESFQPFHISLLLFLRRYTSPLIIKSVWQYAAAMIWLCIYSLMILLKVDIDLLIRKPKVLIKVKDMPHVKPAIKHGIHVHLQNRSAKMMGSL